MMVSHHKNQELLKLLNILRENDSNRKKKLKTKLQVIKETLTGEQQEAIDSTPVFKIIQSECLIIPEMMMWD